MGDKAVPKKFRGNRIYVPTNYPDIKKILVWDEKASEYMAPENGARYFTRKYAVVSGKKQRIGKHFDTLQECFEFRSGRDVTAEVERAQKPDGPTIGQLVAEYKVSPAWDILDFSTQVLYEGVFERWFDLLEEVSIRELDAARVSAWIQDLKKNANRFGNAGQRKSFRKEFDLLKSLLTWYGEYKDDPLFISPIRKRHSDEYWLDNKSHLTVGDNFGEQVDDEIPLTENEYLRFRAELEKSKYGPILVVLADTQYDHSLRVCEAAALFWEDIRQTNPEWTDGEIKFQRHIQYMHRKREVYPDRIVPGLKNKKAVKRKGQRFNRRNALSKTTPFFPRSSRGLRQLYLKAQVKDGLVFRNPDTDSFFTYKCIKDKYDRAFRRAGLPYTGTHIVRYGGVNNFMERYGADEKAAMHLLGNEKENRYVLNPQDLDFQ